MTQSGSQTRKPPLRVLIVDDDPRTIEVLTRFLERDGFETLPALTMEEAYSILSVTVPDVALVDVYLNNEDGLQCVRTMRQMLPDLGIVVISTVDTEELAKAAKLTGADAFLSKPISPTALTVTARRLGEQRQLRVRNQMLQRELESRVRGEVFPEIVFHSDAMRGVLSQLRKVAVRDLTVLVCGESGTGKELAARAIHQSSTRSKGPFVELNCAALPASLVESELFGHEKGAFTGAVVSRSGKIEQAHGGTLFLDEIGELPHEIQPKLLRALQEKRITRVGAKESISCDFRLISATNRMLEDEVRAGRFREDLYYRVAVFPIRLPSLRERLEDLHLLLNHFLKQEGAEHLTLAEEAQKLLWNYPWPGNVRELKNFAQAAPLLVDGGVVDEATVRRYFGLRMGATAMSAPSRVTHLQPGSSPLDGAGLDGTRPVRRLEDLEREEILYALRVFQGNVGEAARALGMGRATLYKYLRRNHIDADGGVQEGEE